MTCVGRHAAFYTRHFRPLTVWQKFPYDPGIGFRQNCRATLVTDLFVGSFDHAVAFTRLTGTNLARCCQLETLFGTAFSLHFGHFAFPSFEVTFETDLAALFSQPVLTHGKPRAVVLYASWRKMQHPRTIYKMCYMKAPSI